MQACPSELAKTAACPASHVTSAVLTCWASFDASGTMCASPWSLCTCGNAQVLSADPSLSRCLLPRAQVTEEVGVRAVRKVGEKWPVAAMSTEYVPSVFEKILQQAPDRRDAGYRQRTKLATGSPTPRGTHTNLRTSFTTVSNQHDSATYYVDGCRQGVRSLGTSTALAADLAVLELQVDGFVPQLQLVSLTSRATSSPVGLHSAGCSFQLLNFLYRCLGNLVGQQRYARVEQHSARLRAIQCQALSPEVLRSRSLGSPAGRV